MLSLVSHRVPLSRRAAMRRFYEALGMQLEAAEAHDVFRYRAPDCAGSAGLELVYQAEDGRFRGGGAYWKIGVAVHDVEVAQAALSLLEDGVRPEMKRPSQFLDVGFLSHVVDPCNFTVELLQTTFEAQAVERARLVARAGGEGPLGQAGEKCMGQITLRAQHLEETLRFYRDLLGMSLICVEPVEPYGFELFFLAFTEELSPWELRDVRTRSWCYQRPFTTLEIQTALGQAVPAAQDLPLELLEAASEAETGVGLMGLTFTAGAHPKLRSIVEAHGGHVVTKDPAGVLVKIVA